MSGTAAALVVVVASAAVAACCGGPRRSESALAVEVVEVAVVRSSPVQLAARVRVAVVGAAVGARLDRVAWTLSIAGSGPVRGVSEVSSAAEEPGARPELSFVARVGRGRAGDIVARLRYGAREYRLEGVAYFTGPTGSVARAFESSGALAPPR